VEQPNWIFLCNFRGKLEPQIKAASSGSKAPPQQVHFEEHSYQIPSSSHFNILSNTTTTPQSSTTCCATERHKKIAIVE